MTTFLKVKNRAVSTLASGISDSDLSLDVKAGEGAKFPSTYPFHITIEDEILSCTNRSTDTLTVTRAQQDTTATAHRTGLAVSLNVTAKSITDLNTAVNTLEGYCPSAAVLEADYNDNTILVANADNTPLPLTIAEQRIVGRKTGGNIAALSGANALLAMGISATVTELNYVDGVTSAIQTQLDAKVAKATLDAYSILAADTDNTPMSVALAASQMIGRKATGGIVAMTGAEALALMTTAVATELNLLDLAGLTAGELLVATAATTAAWQSTGVVLSAPDISGTVTAASALTLPPFNLGGKVTLGGQAFDAGSGNATVTTTGTGKGIQVNSTQDGTDGTKFTGYHISGNPAVGDNVLMLGGEGKDANLAWATYGYFAIQIEATTAGAATGKMAWYPRAAGIYNLAMTLSSAGVLAVDDSASATYGDDDHPVGLFDKYDDALVLRRGIGKGSLSQLVDLGVYERKKDGGYMMRVQPMTKLLAGGIYQNRARIDDLIDVLVTEFPQVAKRLAERNLIALPIGRN